MFSREKTGVAARREEIRKEHWPQEDLWTGQKELGWFPIPRTLPLILSLLRSKQINPDNKDPSSVYLELMSRHRGEGVIEMGHEADHAFASGYEGNRAVRTWQERVKILEKSGFIKTLKVGNRIKYVAIIHPTEAVQHLYKEGKVSENWWNAYLALKRETKEATHEQRQKKKEDARKVVPLIRPGDVNAGKKKRGK